MKNSFLLLLFVSLVSISTALAQHRQHPPHLLELSEELKSELALTPEQVTAIENLQAKTKAAAEALHGNESVEREDRRAAMREIHQNAKAELGEILSDEQLEQLRELRKAKHAEHRALRESIDRDAMRQELKEYREANIQPVMQAQRSKLETQLSAADKESLTEFRVTLAEAKEQARAERQQMREKRPENRSEARGQEGRPHRHHGQRHKKRGLHEQHPEIFSALEAMVDRYDTDISTLLEEVAGQAEQWEADKKAIMQRHVPAELHEKHQARHQGRQPHPEHADKKELGRRIHFLLMEAPAEAEVSAQTEVRTIAAAAYPNPAVNATTLSFQLEEQSVVRIDLRDEQGALVKNITRATYAVGKNQVQIDLGDLNNGTYYLTLNSRKFQAPQSVKILVVK